MVALAPMLALAGDDQLGPARRRAARPRRCWPGRARRPLAAGVLIGLAAAAKFYPLFLLGPLFVLCLRAGRMREFWPTLGGRGRRRGWRSTCPSCWPTSTAGRSSTCFSRERGAGFSSIWFVLSQQGHALPEARLNLVAGGLFALACAGIAVLALARRPAPAAAAARVPRRRGVPADQQGLLAAVRALAASRSPCWPGRAGATS